MFQLREGLESSGLSITGAPRGSDDEPEGPVGWLFVWPVQVTYYSSPRQGSRKEEDKKVVASIFPAHETSDVISRSILSEIK